MRFDSSSKFAVHSFESSINHEALVQNMLIKYLIIVTEREFDVYNICMRMNFK